MEGDRSFFCPFCFKSVETSCIFSVAVMNCESCCRENVHFLSPAEVGMLLRELKRYSSKFGVVFERHQKIG